MCAIWVLTSSDVRIVSDTLVFVYVTSGTNSDYTDDSYVYGVDFNKQ